MKRHHFLPATLLLLAACSNKDKGIAPNFKVDEARSVVEWKGSAPTHFHKGTFRVTGNLLTNGTDKITGGDFVIPIASIDNIDLQGVPKQQLLDHLKSDEFFHIALHPDAKFRITKIEDFHASGVPNVNAKITGDFTMVGQTHPIHFPANVQVSKDKITAEGTFQLKRLDWGMNSYNDPTKELYILPDVDITVKLQGTPAR